MIRLLLLLLALPVLAAEPFEIREGDRVLFLGDTLLEREGAYGYLETRLDEQFPDRHFTVRNLSWAGDTPRGWSRASFDGPEKGWERLKESIASVRPTVVFLGYGMAASLQEMTDRSADITLNPDPARYGEEAMSAGRFKRELGELMDAIQESGKASVPSVRFVLLSPIRHEDLRATRPGLPDPAEHNRMLAEYSKAIEELAKERGGRFLDFSYLPPKNLQVTENGIHLSEQGYYPASVIFARELVIEDRIDRAIFPALAPEKREALRAAVVRKNALFFHRFRPANETYLFGFRKHEQGQNAKEIPMFDPLIDAAEAEIDRLKAAAPGSARVPRAGSGVPPERTSEGAANNTSAADVTRATKVRDGATPSPARGTRALPGGSAPPLPDFTVADGYEIELWAQNPLLEKPTQMNWDPQGRLWICSSSLYPMIEPGGVADDKILILEDNDHTGRATKSTVFAGGLLIPTGVAPDLVAAKEAKDLTPSLKRQTPNTKSSDSESDATQPSTLNTRLSPSSCYVGQSTELLYLSDTDDDGLADQRRIVLSGFGTEDTHHIIHTLHWGPDGRLYFHQSVYIHSHLETPWGMVRLNSGGVFAYDPRTERLEVFARGLWNTWGQQEDEWGQTFLTDGAGSTGLSWAFPGAIFAPSEGSRRQMPSVSPGSYPKFCGLEIVHSPHFPADWQGNAITCDFRAHRVVRFAIKDEGGTAYTTTEQPDLVRTSDLSFRPIDVRLGPDGALYVADWSNPVINHGEVDFRDPRRDHHIGRIWRITRKGSPPVKWEPLVAATPRVAATPSSQEVPAAPSPRDLLDKLLSKNAWEKEQARRVMFTCIADDPIKPETRPEPPSDAPISLQDIAAKEKASDTNPRVRLEAMRALARIPTSQSAGLVLDAALKTPENDPHYDFAAWLSINDLAKPWTDAILSGAWKSEGREAQLEYGLKAIRPELAGAVLAKLGADGKIPFDGSGPWIELIGAAGGPVQLQRLLDGLLAGYVGDCCETDETLAIDHKLALPARAADRAMTALVDAARVRNAGPAAHAELVTALFHAPGAIGEGAVRLAGLWRAPAALEELGKLLDSRETKLPALLAAIDSLRLLGDARAFDLLDKLSRADAPQDVRTSAAIAMTQLKPRAGLARAAEIFPSIAEDGALVAAWRRLLSTKGAMDALTEKIARPQEAKAFSPAVLAAALRAAREQGRKSEKLVAALAPLAGLKAGEVKRDYNALAEETKRQGDPARGELIYRRAALVCATCHAIGGAGGKVGPDLTSMGASAPLDYIIESVLDPAAKVKEGFNAVSLTLKDGAQAAGIQARETATEIFLRDATGREQALPKAQIAAKTDIGSLMPASLTDALAARERLDLFAFLGELGKPGPFDASKGSVARLWRMYPGSAAGEIVRADFDVAAQPGVPGYTLVDGRFVKDLLSESAALVAAGSETVLCVAQFQSSGKTRLHLIGAGKAWLDGQPLALGADVAPELAAGTHTLVVKIGLNELPAVLRSESPDARFLGN